MSKSKKMKFPADPADPRWDENGKSRAPTLREMDVSQAVLDGCSWAAKLLRKRIAKFVRDDVTPGIWDLRQWADEIEKGPSKQ